MPFKPQDGGPIYAETLLSGGEHWLIEPWNAWSSLLFWLPVAYWVWQLWGKFDRHPFLVLCLILLFLGGTGSALFHGLRLSPWLLFMDVLPIALLSIVLSFYFWYLWIGNWVKVALGFTVFIALRVWIYIESEYWIMLVGPHTFINVSYFLNGVLWFLPGLAILYRRRWRGAQWLAFALVFFALSLYFRALDDIPSAFMPIMPWGTHWLWHAFSAAGAGFMGRFVYDLDGENARWNLRT
jgi:hypothetical protein